MREKWLWGIVSICLLVGGFLLGIGTAGFWNQRSAALSGKTPGFSASAHTETLYERDRRNQLLAENRKYVSIEKEVVFEDGKAFGYAGISNGEESQMSCRVTMIQDGTGEILYQSRLIDPGYYIKEIQLQTMLQKGHYSCTALWNFYEGESDLPIGNMAEKIVIIVNQ